MKPSENLVTEKDNELAISGDVKITKTGDAAEKPKQAQQTSFSPSKRWHKTICPSVLGFILYKTSFFVSKLQTLKLSLNTILQIFGFSLSAKKITQNSIQNQMDKDSNKNS